MSGVWVAAVYRKQTENVSGEFKKKISLSWVRERTTPIERPPLVGEGSASFADRECHMLSVTYPYGRILGFLDRSYFFLQVPVQL
jgi:hypothetical protein